MSDDLVADADVVSLPGSLRAAVREEFGRALRQALRPPYETLITVSVNARL